MAGIYIDREFGIDSRFGEGLFLIDGKEKVEDWLPKQKEWEELSEDFRKEFQTSKFYDTSFSPTVYMEFRVEGVGWVKAVPATWLDPPEGGYFEEVSMDVTEESATKDLKELMHNEGFHPSHEDMKILNRIFSRVCFEPDENNYAPIEKIKIDSDGNFKIIFTPVEDTEMSEKEIEDLNTAGWEAQYYGEE